MSRARIATASAALLLIGVSVFGATLSASADVISPPVITSSGGATTDRTPQIDGTVDNPNGRDLTVTVTVTNDEGPSFYCIATVPYSSDAVEAPWGCSSATDLAYELGLRFTAVVAEDLTPTELSTPSNEVQFSIGGAQAATLDDPAPGATTSDATPTFSGTGPSLGTIDVNDGSLSYCASTVDAAGSWTCTVTAPLAAAVYPAIRASATPITGIGTTTAPQSLEVLAPPAPTVDQTFDPWITSSDAPDIQGGKLAEVDYVQGYWSTDGVNWTPYCQTNATLGATIWYCDPPFGSLPIGDVLVAAISFNEAGDASPLSAPISIQRVAEPVVLTPADGSFINDPTPLISGTAPGTSVTLWTNDEGTICADVPVVDGVFECQPALEDGTYAFTLESVPGSWVTSGPWTFTVDTIAPATPVISGPPVPLATTSSTHPTITGTGEPGAVIDLVIDGAPTVCVGAPITVGSDGTWSCQVAPAQALGTYQYAARQTDRAGNTSGGPLVTQLGLTIVAVPAPTPSATPVPEPAQNRAPWSFTFGVGSEALAPGDSTVISATGLPPGATVDVEFHSTPVLLGSTVVGPDGTFELLVTIPDDAEAGDHEFVVLITPLEGPPSTQQHPVVVVAPERAIQPAGNADLDTTALPLSQGPDRSSPAAPSGLTGAIQTLGSVIADPIVIGTAALSGLALLLLVAFPAELLNSTISEQYQRFSRRVPKLTALERFTNWLEQVPWLGALLITVIAAVIFGFADPGFGFDITSLRVVLACAIALFIVGYLASAISGAIIRRRWRLATTMELKPLGLVLTVAGVVLSRLLDFSPGFLIGLLLGIGIIGRTTVGERAKATLVQAGVVFALAMLGWVGYSMLLAGGEPDTFTSALVVDTLVAVTTEGLTTLFIGLLPFRMLDGSAIFEHSKLAWAAAYAVAAAAFVLIVVPSAWGELDGSLVTWVAVLGGFAIAAIGLYLYFRFVAPAPEEHGPESSAELSDAQHSQSTTGASRSVTARDGA